MEEEEGDEDEESKENSIGRNSDCNEKMNPSLILREIKKNCRSF